jgi:F0F1-type ATP synthase assembly protein I
MTAGPPDRRPADDDGPVPVFRQFLGLGTLIALCLAAGFGLGWLVDDRLRTTPVFTFVGLTLGIVLAVSVTAREVRNYLRK